jgi:hypothetical protein
MSKQMGLIKLKGNIGGISFYKSGGEDLARVANGPSRERIQNDATFQRTRENNNEFGGAATAAKALRMGLVTVLQDKGDSHLPARLTKIFREIVNKNTGQRGQRSIVLSGNRGMLDGFDFNERIGFSGIFNAPFTVVPNAARNQSVITVAPFMPKDLIKAPSGATYFRLVSGLGVVSDYTYNVVTGRYEATDPTLNMLNVVANGAVTAQGVAAPVSFTLTDLLPGTPAPVMTATTSVVQCLGIEFYQRVGTVDYLLSQGNCMKVVKVF